MTTRSLRGRYAMARQPNFRWMLSGTVISYTGSGMQFVATGWLVMKLTGEVASVAIVLLSLALPGLLVTPILGRWVDMLDRQHIVVACDLMRGVATLAIPLLGYFDVLSLWEILVVNFIVGVGDEGYKMSSTAFLREIVPRGDLLMANTSLGIALQIGGIIGAGLSGLIVAILGVYAVYIMNAASFLSSAFCMGRISRRRRRRIGLPSAQGAVVGMKGSIVYLLGKPDLMFVYLMLTSFVIVLRTINVLLPSFVTHDLQAGSFDFGLIEMGFAGGAMAGGLAIPAIVSRVGSTRAGRLLFPLLVSAVAAMSVVADVGLAILVYALIGFAYQARFIYVTQFQKLADVNMMGRIQAIFQVIFSAIAISVYLGVGLISTLVSTRSLYAIQAAQALAVPLLLSCISMVRRLRSSR